MRREKRREKRKRGDNFHLGMKRNFSLAGVIHVQFDQFSAKLRRISTKYNVLIIQLRMPGSPYHQESIPSRVVERVYKNYRLA